jgi:hypothetical protein
MDSWGQAFMGLKLLLDIMCIIGSIHYHQASSPFLLGHDLAAHHDCSNWRGQPFGILNSFIET